MKRNSLMFCVLTMIAFGILVKLGFWQLTRAEEKQALMTLLESRGQNTLAWPLVTNDLRGYRLAVSARPLLEKSLLLDNQIQDRQVGYRWFLPVEVTQANELEPWLLVDMGFIGAKSTRSELPSLPDLPKTVFLIGRFYQPGINRLSQALLAEQTNPIRIQAVNWLELEQLLEHKLVPAILMLEQPENVGFSPRWQPINLSPEKHQGYALQWFGLALGLVVVAFALWRKTAHSAKHKN